MARALGWQLSRDGLVRLDARDGYIACPPNGYRVFAPWTLPPFSTLYEQIKPWTLVSDDRCYVLHQFAKHCARLPGDFVECGVYKGGTAMLSARTLRDLGATNKPFHLFDTFEGMPANADNDASGHGRGDFGDTSLEAVQSRMREFTNVQFHPGYIPTTLEAVRDRTFSYVYADLDLYQSTIDALNFLYLRMTPGGVFICDDYGFIRYKDAAHKAVDEFFADKPEQVIVLRTGQCLVIKL
jgi:O-methyltransferase